MWFQHLAWNHVCMISYLHCLVFKEHCFLTSFVKSLSDFCKLSVWVSFYIIPHSVPFVKNFFEIFFITSFKATSASVQLQGFALLYLSDNDVYITTNLHLCQHFYKIFLIFFLPLINSDLPNTSIIYTLLVGIAYTLTGTLSLYWCAKLSPINGDMGVPFQARSRYFSRLAVLKLSWGNSWLTPRKLMNR